MTLLEQCNDRSYDAESLEFKYQIRQCGIDFQVVETSPGKLSMSPLLFHEVRTCTRVPKTQDN